MLAFGATWRRNKETKMYHYLLEEVVELLDCAQAPPESLGGVPEVAHDESVLPAALPRPWAAQVGGRGGAVVDGAKAEGGLKKK